MSEPYKDVCKKCGADMVMVWEHVWMRSPTVYVQRWECPDGCGTHAWNSRRPEKEEKKQEKDKPE